MVNNTRHDASVYLQPEIPSLGKVFWRQGVQDVGNISQCVTHVPGIQRYLSKGIWLFRPFATLFSGEDKRFEICKQLFAVTSRLATLPAAVSWNRAGVLDSRRAWFAFWLRFAVNMPNHHDSPRPSLASAAAFRFASACRFLSSASIPVTVTPWIVSKSLVGTIEIVFHAIFSHTLTHISQPMHSSHLTDTGGITASGYLPSGTGSIQSTGQNGTQASQPVHPSSSTTAIAFDRAFFRLYFFGTFGIPL